ncbi:hypothetical protein, partial [Sediminibacterium sp. C3]|uniref:hypothetical protein n=1 Tax=Sediminibacterium sp. C3 TaxID=1267211 RepID=UPI00056D61A1
NFHKNTLQAVVELMESSGYKELSDIKSANIFRRISQLETKSLEEIYFKDTLAISTKTMSQLN